MHPQQMSDLRNRPSHAVLYQLGTAFWNSLVFLVSSHFSPHFHRSIQPILIN